MINAQAQVVVELLTRPGIELLQPYVVVVAPVPGTVDTVVAVRSAPQFGAVASVVTRPTAVEESVVLSYDESLGVSRRVRVEAHDPGSTCHIELSMKRSTMRSALRHQADYNRKIYLDGYAQGFLGRLKLAAEGDTTQLLSRRHLSTQKAAAEPPSRPREIEASRIFATDISTVWRTATADYGRLDELPMGWTPSGTAETGSLRITVDRVDDRLQAQVNEYTSLAFGESFTFRTLTLSFMPVYTCAMHSVQDGVLVTFRAPHNGTDARISRLLEKGLDSLGRRLDEFL